MKINRKKKTLAKIGSILFILWIPLFAFAQAKVELSVDESQVAVGDFINVVIQVTADKNVSIEPPKMPAFADLTSAGSSQQISDGVNIINGQYKFVRVQRYIFLYQTTVQGDLDIPPVQVIVDGKTYTTNGAKLKVLDPGNIARQQPPQRRLARPPGGFPPDEAFRDPFEELEEQYQQLLRRGAPRVGDIKTINPNEAFAVRLELDKNRAYVGEQLTASYYIYVPEGSILRSIDTIKFPSLNNFWKEDIEIATRLTFEPADINGKRYTRALLASYALFPIKHGNLKIDSYKVRGGIASQSVFGFGKTTPYTKASDEVSVTILPLPDANRPLDFNGIVGDFQIEAKLEESRFKTGQPFTLKVKIAGRGNAKVAELPPLNLPDSLELFDKKEEAKFFPNGQSYKEFSLYITPKEVGLLTIPAIGFSYFDPSRMQYMKKATNPIQIQVEKGESYNPTNSPLVEKKQSPTGQLPSLSATLYSSFSVNDTWSLWIFIIIVILILMFFLYRLITGLKSNHTAKILQAKVKGRWAKVKNLSNKEDYKNFAIEASNFINLLLGEIVGEEGSIERLQKNIILLPISLRKEVETDLVSTIEILQAIAFAPAELTADIRNKKKMKEVLQTIDRVGQKLLEFKLQQLRL